MSASKQLLSHERYKLIPRTLIFIMRGDSVLLLKGASQKGSFSNLYNGVGGHIERGEDVTSAALRELKEETGLIPESLRLCGTVTIDVEEQIGIGLFIFKGTSNIGEPSPSQEGLLEWFPIEKLEQAALVEDLHQLLPKVITHQDGDPPIAGHYFYNLAGDLQIRFST